jgi:hypothetical protein
VDSLDNLCSAFVEQQLVTSLCDVSFVLHMKMRSKMEQTMNANFVELQKSTSEMLW